VAYAKLLDFADEAAQSLYEANAALWVGVVYVVLIM
jgi:hypothetical protein